MKRIIAVVLLLATVLGMAGVLGGCGTGPSMALSMGQWVSLVADSFGMQSYTEEDPFFAQVKETDPAFGAFQAVAEWGVIQPSDQISSQSPVTWRQVLISLVNAGEFLPEDASDEEKMDYAIAHFGKGIRTYWANRFIKMKEAVPLLDQAQQQWADRTFTETVEEVTFNENVTDFSGSEGLEYSVEGDVITVAEDEFAALKPGDVYTLPANGTEPVSINKVGSVEVVDGKVVITNAEFAEDDLAQYVGDLRIQETSAPDFTQIGGIYDEYGNPISYTIEPGNAADGMSFGGNGFAAAPMDCSGDAGLRVAQMGLFDNVNGTLKFEVGEYEFSLSTAQNDVSLGIAKEIKERGTTSVEVFGKAIYKNMQLTKDVEFNSGSLEKAEVKLHYTHVLEVGLGIEDEKDLGIGVEKGDTTTMIPMMKIRELGRQSMAAIKSMAGRLEDKKSEDSFYICRIHLLGGNLANVSFILKGKISAEGEFKVSFEIAGAQGVEYKNGNLRYIKTTGTDCDAVMEGEVEGVLAVGVAVTVLKRIVLVEFTVEGGLGASMSKKWHLFDAEGHELYSSAAMIGGADAAALAAEVLYTSPEDLAGFAEEQGGFWDASEASGSVKLVHGICWEWELYPILRLGIDEGSLIGTIAKSAKAKLLIHFLGDDTPILSGHADFPNSIVSALRSESFDSGMAAFLGIGAECTYAYKPWDDAADRLDEPEENEDVPVGDMLLMSVMRIDIKEGGIAYLEVAVLPEGYELKDIEAVAEDEEIAVIDKDGRVTGLKDGVTQIVVQTKDGKHMTYCAVSVSSDKVIEFEALPANSSNV